MFSTVLTLILTTLLATYSVVPGVFSGGRRCDNVSNASSLSSSVGAGPRGGRSSGDSRMVDARVSSTGAPAMDSPCIRVPGSPGASRATLSHSDCCRCSGLGGARERVCGGVCSDVSGVGGVVSVRGCSLGSSRMGTVCSVILTSGPRFF